MINVYPPKLCSQLQQCAELSLPPKQIAFQLRSLRQSSLFGSRDQCSALDDLTAYAIQNRKKDIYFALLKLSALTSQSALNPSGVDTLQEMATDTMTSPLSIASHVVLEEDTGAAQSSELGLHDEGDNRSSSLSDLGERPGHDRAEEDLRDLSDGIDTEAETERLEESPQKDRKQQNVVLTTTTDLYNNPQLPLPFPAVSDTSQRLGRRQCQPH